MIQVSYLHPCLSDPVRIFQTVWIKQFLSGGISNLLFAPFTPQTFSRDFQNYCGFFSVGMRVERDSDVFSLKKVSRTIFLQ